MPRVVMTNHSTFYDMKRKVQFDPVLDQRTGCFVAVAQVDDEKAAEFEGHERFQIISDAEFLEMITRQSAPEPSGPATGDPLTDAGAKSLMAPPKIPKGK